MRQHVTNIGADKPALLDETPSVRAFDIQETDEITLLKRQLLEKEQEIERLRESVDLKNRKIMRH